MSILLPHGIVDVIIVLLFNDFIIRFVVSECVGILGERRDVSIKCFGFVDEFDGDEEEGDELNEDEEDTEDDDDDEDEEG